MCAAPRHALVRARGASRDMPPAARGGGMFAIPLTPPLGSPARGLEPLCGRPRAAMGRGGTGPPGAAALGRGEIAPARTHSPTLPATGCPLCMEDMDVTDRNFRPCKCGYQICLFCYNKIKDDAVGGGEKGVCPACCTPYDEANATFVTPDPQEMARMAKEKKAREQRRSGSSRRARRRSSRTAWRRSARRRPRRRRRRRRRAPTRRAPPSARRAAAVRLRARASRQRQQRQPEHDGAAGRCGEAAGGAGARARQPAYVGVRDGPVAADRPRGDPPPPRVLWSVRQSAQDRDHPHAAVGRERPCLPLVVHHVLQPRGSRAGNPRRRRRRVGRRTLKASFGTCQVWPARAGTHAAAHASAARSPPRRPPPRRALVPLRRRAAAPARRPLRRRPRSPPLPPPRTPSRPSLPFPSAPPRRT